MSLLDQLSLEPNLESNLEDALPQDPEPGTRAPRRKQKAPAQAPKATAPKRSTAPRGKSTASLAKEVGEDLATLIELTAAGWGMRDACCAPVLAEQAQPLGEAVAAILARNPRLLAKFALIDSASVLVLWVTLARALQPVVSAIYRNHGPGTRAPVDEGDEGPHPAAVDLATYPAFSGVPRAHTA